jgi:hypothetical protein
MGHVVDAHHNISWASAYGSLLRSRVQGSTFGSASVVRHNHYISGASTLAYTPRGRNVITLGRVGFTRNEGYDEHSVLIPGQVG